MTSFSAMGVHVSLARVATAKRRRIRKSVGQVKQAFTPTSHNPPTDDWELAKAGYESVARFRCRREEGGHGRLEIRGRGQDRQIQEDVADLREGVKVRSRFCRGSGGSHHFSPLLVDGDDEVTPDGRVPRLASRNGSHRRHEILQSSSIQLGDVIQLF